jgi:hypothetical protein
MSSATVNYFWPFDRMGDRITCKGKYKQKTREHTFIFVLGCPVIVYFLPPSLSSRLKKCPPKS